MATTTNISHTVQKQGSSYAEAVREIDGCSMLRVSAGNATGAAAAVRLRHVGLLHLISLNSKVYISLFRVYGLRR